MTLHYTAKIEIHDKLTLEISAEATEDHDPRMVVAAVTEAVWAKAKEGLPDSGDGQNAEDIVRAAQKNERRRKADTRGFGEV